MDYHSDSRAHDSGYFTPSPDKINHTNNHEKIVRLNKIHIIVYFNKDII